MIWNETLTTWTVGYNANNTKFSVYANFNHLALNNAFPQSNKRFKKLYGPNKDWESYS